MYSQLLPKPPIPMIVHPYMMANPFVGRSEELSLISAWCFSNEPIHLVVGSGGSGKSALMWKWTGRYSQEAIQQLAGTVWGSFYESDFTMEKFIKITLAYILATSFDKISQLKRDEAEQLLFIELAKKPYLLVLDGLERLLSDYQSIKESELGARAFDDTRNSPTFHEPRDGKFLKMLSRAYPIDAACVPRFK